MARRVKLGTKLFLSFLVMLALACLIAVISLAGFRSVADRVEVNTDLNRMLADVLQMRQYEADFIIRNDAAAAEKVTEAAGLLKAQVDRYLAQRRMAEMAEAGKILDGYLAGFQSYVALEAARSALEEELDESGRAALAHVRSIQEGVQSGLAEVIDWSDRFVARKLDQLYDANQLLLRLAHARLLRLSLIRKTHRYVLNKWQAENRRIGALLETMAANATRGRNADRLREGLFEYRSYSALFLKYLEDRGSVDRKEIMRMTKRITAGMEAILTDQGDQVREALKNQSDTVVAGLEKAAAANRMIDLLMKARQHEKMYLLHPEQVHAEAVATSIRQLSDLASGLLGNSESAGDAAAVGRSLSAYRSDFEEYTELVVAQADQAEAMAGTAKRLNTVFARVRDAGAGEMRAGMGRAETAIYVTVALALALGFCFAFFNTRGIVRPISRTMETLRSSSGRLAGASEQMDDASRSLAESASEQAATVEQTAASMEEIAAMMATGRSSTEQIERLMTGALERVREADDILRRLTAAMDDILGASREISKIHKSIDELAFQTNLLSLNAAIEAARVGEYGSGFAVVAEEVRNLAGRSAESARGASEMIETTTGRIDTGKSLVDSANRVFSEVRRAMEETSDVMEDLTSAAGEQTRAIDQVNRATSEMDRTIQENAASAEETAAALSEMSRQSESLERIVADLGGLIHGGRKGAPAASRQIAYHPSGESETEPQEEGF